MSRFQQTFEDRARLAGDRAFGVTITYRRGGMSVSNVTAIPEMVVHEIFGQDGFESRVHAREYLIAVSAIVLGGSAREPKEGDRILETINGTVTQFVVARAGQKKAFELLDGGYRWRIRTVEENQR